MIESCKVMPHFLLFTSCLLHYVLDVLIKLSISTSDIIIVLVNNNPIAQFIYMVNLPWELMNGRRSL